MRDEMTKGEIIEGVLKEFTASSIEDDPEYEQLAIDHLDEVFREEDPYIDIRTCSDFSHLGIECCDTCYHFTPGFEMKLDDIESGGKAWICCAMSRALNPNRAGEAGAIARGARSVLPRNAWRPVTMTKGSTD